FVDVDRTGAEALDDAVGDLRRARRCDPKLLSLARTAPREIQEAAAEGLQYEELVQQRQGPEVHTRLPTQGAPEDGRGVVRHQVQLHPGFDRPLIRLGRALRTKQR